MSLEIKFSLKNKPDCVPWALFLHRRGNNRKSVCTLVAGGRLDWLMTSDAVRVGHGGRPSVLPGGSPGSHWKGNWKGSSLYRTGDLVGAPDRHGTPAVLLGVTSPVLRKLIQRAILCVNLKAKGRPDGR